VPRAGVTTTRIVEQAELLADDVGLSNVSLAVIAERLGVRVPSLYKHVAGREALDRLVEARAKAELGEVLARATVGKSRDGALDSMASAYRQWAQQHPGRYCATVVAPNPDDPASVAASAALVSIVFDALAGYALTGDDAIDATRAFRAALHGFVSLETVGGFGMPHDIDRSFERLVAGLRLALAQWNHAS